MNKSERFLPEANSISYILNLFLFNETKLKNRGWYIRAEGGAHRGVRGE